VGTRNYSVHLLTLSKPSHLDLPNPIKAELTTGSEGLDAQQHHHHLRVVLKFVPEGAFDLLKQQEKPQLQ
jgi:hypothetical protein